MASQKSAEFDEKKKHEDNISWFVNRKYKVQIEAGLITAEEIGEIYNSVLSQECFSKNKARLRRSIPDLVFGRTKAIIAQKMRERGKKRFEEK